MSCWVCWWVSVEIRIAICYYEVTRVPEKASLSVLKFANREDVQSWMDANRNQAALVVSARAAMRTIPALFPGLDYLQHSAKVSQTNFCNRIVGPSFRFASFAYMYARNSSEVRKRGETASIFSAINTTTKSGQNLFNRSKYLADIKSVLYSLSDAVDATVADKLISEYASRSVGFACFAVNDLIDYRMRKFGVESSYEFLDEMRVASADCSLLDAGTSCSKLLSRPLWLDGMPDWAIWGWNNLKHELLKKEENWNVWTDWFEARRDGAPLRRKQMEIERLCLPDELWKSGMAKLNRRLSDILTSEIGPQADSAESDDRDKGQALDQRPSSHQFDWRKGQMQATPVAEPPFDAFFAETLLKALRNKSQKAIIRLRENDADEDLQSEVQALITDLVNEVDEMNSGNLLTRYNTLSAYAAVYLDPTTERNPKIRVVVADLAASLSNFIDCYSLVRKINANRIELEVQSADAQRIAGHIDEIIEVVSNDQGISKSVIEALRGGQAEYERIESKIVSSYGGSRAEYIYARAQIVSARLLDATNFVSAAARKASNEIVGLGSDSWREIRKTLPKATAKGLAKGMERGMASTIGHFPDVVGLLLAHAVAGPWGLIATLVPRLLPHSNKVSEIVDTEVNSQGD